MKTNQRPFVAHILLTIFGTIVFCVYSQSWYDATHLLYDIPAGLATFGFVSQLLLDTFTPLRFSAFWFHRLLMLTAMTFATVGRQYWEWPISGHLSCVLAIALMQTGDIRWSRSERAAYWIPVLTVLFLRLAILEHGGHYATYAALAFSMVWGLPGMFLACTQPSKG